MKKYRIRISTIYIALLISLLFSFPVMGIEIPPVPAKRITDLTGTLSQQFINRMEKRLIEYEKKTSNQIAVLMIPTLSGYPLEDYSIRVAEKWKIGQKGKDNGVIILIVKKDRKIRIEVGYGLEDVLTDARAGDIIRSIMAPHFRKGDFEGGIEKAIGAIIAITEGKFKGPIRSRKPQHIPWFFGIPFFGLFLSVGGFILGHSLTYLKKKKLPLFLFWWSIVFIGIPFMMAFNMLGNLAIVLVFILIISIIVGYKKFPYKGHLLKKSGRSGWAIVSGVKGGFASGSSSGGGGSFGGGGGFGGGGASGGW